MVNVLHNGISLSASPTEYLNQKIQPYGRYICYKFYRQMCPKSDQNFWNNIVYFTSLLSVDFCNWELKLEPLQTTFTDSGRTVFCYLHI